MSNRVLAGILGLALVVAVGGSLVTGPSKEVRAATFAVEATPSEGESCGGGCGGGSKGGACGAGGGSATEGGSCAAPEASKPAGTCPFSGKTGAATGM